MMRRARKPIQLGTRQRLAAVSDRRLLIDRTSMTHRQIAEKYGVTEAAVTIRLGKVRDRLEEEEDW